MRRTSHLQHCWSSPGSAVPSRQHPAAGGIKRRLCCSRDFKHLPPSRVALSAHNSIGAVDTVHPCRPADFVSNWVWHLDKIGLGNFLVGAMDKQLLERLAGDGVPAFSMASGLTTEDFGWCAA